MYKIIGVTDLQRSFRRVFDEVVRSRVPYILTRDSRPEAALVAYEDFVKFRQMQEAEVEARMESLLARMRELNAEFSEEEVEADLKEAAIP